MNTEGSGASRAGGDQFHNEDVFLVEDGLGLYVVCDGASDRPAGEIAARVAAEALEAFISRAESHPDRESWHDLKSTAVVEQGLRFAMRAVLDAEQLRPEFRSMDTTITMLLAHGARGVIGHVGDSRAYLIRRERAHQLTVDHELTDRVAAGDGGACEMDAFALDLSPGDTLVLCTDGAEDVVHDSAIARVAGDLSPRLLASRIVSAANRNEPTLDATAVVIRVRDEHEPGWLELSFPPRSVSFGHTQTYNWSDDAVETRETESSTSKRPS